MTLVSIKSKLLILMCALEQAEAVSFSYDQEIFYPRRCILFLRQCTVFVL